MTTLLGDSKLAEEHNVADNDTLESIAMAKCAALGWKVLARYNWGSDNPPEVRRALCETVGVDLADLLNNALTATPEKLKLKPYTALSPKLKVPKAWKLDSAEVLKTHTIEVKRKRPATAVAITTLANFFDPAAASCPVTCQYEGEAARATKRDFEVHAPYTLINGKWQTGYYWVEKRVIAAVDGGDAYPERPCGTFDKSDLTQTHILCRNVAAAPGPETIPWDGTSDATQGELKTPLKINSRFAPYNVLIRYYKDDADKEIRLKLSPFCPRWKLTATNTYTLQDDSLVVNWTIEGQDPSKDKLKLGQLTVWDKDRLVFIAPLTKDQIKAGSYDLINGPVKWDKSKVERANLPYRIQIQAHSDAEQDNGLALAVMPTQVPPNYYEQVQLIGFNIENDTIGTDYRGDDDPAVDIEQRCSVMIEAIQNSYASTNVVPKILKVFVAPEFYFRGTNGAYPFENIHDIVPRLRKETDAAKYVDWLFVFGTAIGSYKHELAAAKVPYCEKELPVKILDVTDATTIQVKLWTAPQKGWVIAQNALKQTIISSTKGAEDRTDTSATWAIKLADTTGLTVNDAKMVEAIVAVQGPDTEITLTSPACSRIPVQKLTTDAIVIGGLWSFESGGVAKDILKAELKSDGSYVLTVPTGGNYQVGQPFKLLEPKTTEIINVALVQKGWHSPLLGDGSLRQVVTYKEFISPIDYQRNTSLDIHEKTGINRKVRIYKTDDQPVLPTTGSTDIGGASPNITRQPRKAAGSEINLTGLGGGCVFSMHGVTFGLEVCLDHAEDRLWNFYNSGGSNKRAGDPKVQVQLIPSYGMSIGSCQPGRAVSAVDDGIVFNVDGQRMESQARIWDHVYSCDIHWSKVGIMGDKCNLDQYQIQSGQEVYNCWHASHGFLPNPWRTYGVCGTHGAYVCNKHLQELGTGFGPGPKIAVASSSSAYFSCPGNVQVFPANDLPDPDVV